MLSFALRVFCAMEEPYVITTKKGKPSLVFGMYSYRVHKTTQEYISWLCIKEKKSKCRGRVKTTLQHAIIPATTMEHSCVPNKAELDVNRARHNCRKRAREEVSVPVNVIYKEEFSGLYSQGFELVTEVPKYDSMKTVLCRDRRGAIGTDQNPKSSNEIVFPDDLLTLPDGRSFLLADKTIRDKRMIIFGGEDTLQLLEKQDATYFFDGTFKSCPKQFCQLYTIHVDIGSSDTETNVCPAVYAFLPDKTEDTYFHMLMAIKESFPSWKPSTIKIDFEVAVISAIQRVLPHTGISGCSFHFSQSIWRKIQTIGLTSEYKENQEVAKTCRRCAALVHIPPQNIDDAWLIIMEDAPEDNVKLTEFLDYFVEQWLENLTITRSMWNVYEQRHRTNNAVEGWNSKLNALVGRKAPNIFFLIEKLKLITMEVSFILKSKELGESGTKRRKVFTKLDQRIKNILDDFKKGGDLKKCLSALSYVNKLE